MAKKSEKHVGDVIGLGRSRAKAPVASKSTSSKRRASGIELPSATRRTTKRAGVVGGVRGRGR